MVGAYWKDVQLDEQANEQAGDVVQCAAPQQADVGKKRKAGEAGKVKTKRTKACDVPSPLTRRNLDVDLESVSRPSSPDATATAPLTV